MSSFWSIPLNGWTFNNEMKQCWTLRSFLWTTFVYAEFKTSQKVSEWRMRISKKMKLNVLLLNQSLLFSWAALSPSALNTIRSTMRRSTFTFHVRGSTLKSHSTWNAIASWRSFRWSNDTSPRRRASLASNLSPRSRFAKCSLRIKSNEFVKQNKIFDNYACIGV